MADISGNGNGNVREEAVMVNLTEEVEHLQQIEAIHNPKPMKKQNSLLSVSVPFLQKVLSLSPNIPLTSYIQLYNIALFQISN